MIAVRLSLTTMHYGRYATTFSKEGEQTSVILTMGSPLSKPGKSRLFMLEFALFLPLISDFDNGFSVVKIPILPAG